MIVNSLDEILGKTIVGCNIPTSQSDILIFQFSDSSYYVFNHQQDCCENVYIEDTCGDMHDLLNSPLLQAEEVSMSASGENAPPRLVARDDSNTWTFYRFATIHGSLSLRWLGSSNGYYSESVDHCFYTDINTIPESYFQSILNSSSEIIGTLSLPPEIQPRI